LLHGAFPQPANDKVNFLTEKKTCFKWVVAGNRLIRKSWNRIEKSIKKSPPALVDTTNLIFEMQTYVKQRFLMHLHIAMN